MRANLTETIELQRSGFRSLGSPFYDRLGEELAGEILQRRAGLERIGTFRRRTVSRCVRAAVLRRYSQAGTGRVCTRSCCAISVDGGRWRRGYGYGRHRRAIGWGSRGGAPCSGGPAADQRGRSVTCAGIRASRHRQPHRHADPSS